MREPEGTYSYSRTGSMPERLNRWRQFDLVIFRQCDGSPWLLAGSMKMIGKDVVDYWCWLEMSPVWAKI
jgi:hypothetical protein